MSQTIIKEVIFLIHAVLLGVFITCAYDGFIILRRLIKHNIFMVSLEDMIFWIGCAIAVFCMLYEQNNGVVRWFAVAGAALGMLIYKKTISHMLVKTAVGILARAGTIVAKALHFLLSPVCFLGKKLKAGCSATGKKSSKAGKYLKKKLTAYKKLLKIILCKQ